MLASPFPANERVNEFGAPEIAGADASRRNTGRPMRVQREPKSEHNEFAAHANASVIVPGRHNGDLVLRLLSPRRST